MLVCPFQSNIDDCYKHVHEILRTFNLLLQVSTTAQIKKSVVYPAVEFDRI